MHFIFPVDNKISSTENYYDDKIFDVKAYISFIVSQLTSVIKRPLKILDSTRLIFLLYLGMSSNLNFPKHILAPFKA